MMIKDSFFISLKNLRHRGIRSWLTLIGIFIGVTAVVSLISLGSGLKVAINSQFGVSSTELITIQAGGVEFGPPGEGAVTPLLKNDADAIARLGSVKRAVARYIASGKLEYNDHVVFGYATSIPKDSEDARFVYDEIDGDPEVGRFLRSGERNKVFLGYNFYVDKVGLERKVVPGNTVLVQDKEFEVVGILEKKGSFIMDNAVFMAEEDMIDLWQYGDEIDLIVAQPQSKELIERAKTDIENLLRRRRNVKVGEEDFSVSTPEASLEAINSVLTGVQVFIVLIASISIFIGSIGIVNTMTTSVLERRREIGIMKAIGARNSHIFLQFFIEAGLLGLIGGFVGVVFGTLIGFLGTAAIGNFVGSSIGLNLSLPLIFFALFGSFLVGSIAGIIPAMRAAKQNPVEALRG